MLSRSEVVLLSGAAGRNVEAVKESLVYLKHETDVWFEITTLLIPDENDSDHELEALTQWVVEALGTDVPVHFSAFHPDFKLRDRGRTPLDTLLRARAIARGNGLRFVYTGSVSDTATGSTWCPSCDTLLVERTGYTLGTWGLSGAHCGACDAACDAGMLCDGAGICALSCQTGLSDCGGTCVDLARDSANCGVRRSKWKLLGYGQP